MDRVSTTRFCNERRDTLTSKRAIGPQNRVLQPWFIARFSPIAKSLVFSGLGRVAQREVPPKVQKVWRISGYEETSLESIQCVACAPAIQPVRWSLLEFPPRPKF